MAQKITQTQINEMLRLYSEIGTYSGVAKQMNISASTASKYIKAAAQSNIKVNTQTNIIPKSITNISLNSVLSFSNLTEEEQISYNAWLKEFGR